MIFRAAGGRRIAAVEEDVHEDVFETVFGSRPEQGVEMALVGVDSAIGEQAEQMQLAIALAGANHGLGDHRVRGELAAGNQRVDAGDVHVDDAARADVEMADFAVAHLAVGQADEVIGGMEQGVGKLGEQLVVGGLAGQRNGVGLGLRPVAPAIEDGQDQRFLMDRHTAFRA